MRVFRPSLFLVCLLPASGLNAQQIPTFIGQFEHPALFNPARNGDGLIAVNYRQQWLGLEGESAPVSYYLHADVSHLFKLRDKRIGLGFQFMGDKAHIVSTNRISLDFAYHLIEDSNQRLSAGIRAGFASQSLEFGDVRVNDPFDLELFSGSTSGSSLDGGPGIAYYRKMDDGGALHLDLSALQLFADRLEHDEGSFFDWQRHLVARASYRFPLGASGLQAEPTLVYRQAVDEFQLKKDKLDFAIRGHYQDRFRFTLGTRVGAQAYYLGFAIDFGDSAPLGAQAAYETDDVFGGSYEVGLTYYSGEETVPRDPIVKTPKEPKPSKPERTKDPVNTTTKPVRRPKIDFTPYRAAIASVIEGAATGLDRAEGNLTDAKSFLGQAGKAGITSDEKRTGLRLAGEKMETAINNLRSAANSVDRGRGSIASLREEAGYAPGEKIADRKTLKIVTEFRQLEARYADLERRRSGLAGDLAGMEASVAPTVLADLRTGNIAGVERYFNDKVAALNRRPPGFGPLTVMRNGNGSLRLTLPYAKSVSVFSIDAPERADVKELITVIGWEIKRLRDQGVTVSGVTLRAELRDPEEDQLLDEEAGVYGGEFGSSSTSFEYTFVNGISNTRQPRTAIINSGDIDFLQLTGLKLESMKRELNKIGFSRSEIGLEIAAPVGQQGQERYLILFDLR